MDRLTLGEQPAGHAEALSHAPRREGFRVTLEGSGDESFTSSTFSPDGTKLTIGIYPGVGRKGNADVWIANLDKNERIDRLTPLTGRIGGRAHLAAMSRPSCEGSLQVRQDATVRRSSCPWISTTLLEPSAFKTYQASP